MKKRNMLLVIALFLLVLSASRTLWMSAFHDLSDRHVQNGQLDLSDWHANGSDVLLLDGEWEFYPSQWLMDGKSEVNDLPMKLVEVPGKWNDDFKEGESTPYGYGSYRLRLYVNPEKPINYSLYIPSVRSSSELYVNGRLLAGSGQVGKSEDEYTPKNLPYTTTFTANENGVIDIVIQAANFKDDRRSGIIRSIKFGSEAAIVKERHLSLAMQMVASIIFLVHSIYALALFFLGNREKKLLFYSLLFFCITFMNLISNDEKLFHLLIDGGYERDFRLANSLIPIACFALLNAMDDSGGRFWRIIKPIYLTVNITVAIVTWFLSPSQILMLFPVYYLMAGIAIAVALFTIAKKIYQDFVGNFLLFLSFLAGAHHFIWVIYWREAGVSVVHYPFDLIISIGCFASIWFKDYFSMHAETANLAVRLQKMNEHKDQFLASTSHEFKNPLHGIINMTQAVLNREKHVAENTSVHELETILTVSRRMSLLLNDLLDVASLREGKPRLQKKNISIQPIITGVMDMLHFSQGGKPVKIVNEVPDHFPPVMADENRVIQIVYNLLHNAVKYTMEGEIRIQAEVKNDRAFIVVTDTGIGMEEDFLQRLFLPYEQAAEASLIEGGLGLGLNISKQLIELHGGQLDVSSVLGKGSTFTFSLQLASPDENVLETSVQHVESTANRLADLSIELATAEMSAAVEVKPISNRPPILIVDDDPVNLQVLQSILSDEQYDITTAINGKEALALLPTKEWGLVISDIMMPQMSGYELTKTIRKRYSFTELPILLLTARSNPKDIQAGFLAGANDYVTKPVEMLELKSRVLALTTIKKAVREQLQLEAAWLQAQIQPHFLFNTLTSVIALSDIDLDEMNHLLVELSQYLRSKFQFQHIDELIPLEEELAIVRSYLNIEQVRFGDRLTVNFVVDECGDVKIPFLSIQPLVENAVRHGLMKRISGGTLTIRITAYEGYVEIAVEDDGVGMDEVQLQDLLERKEGNRMSIGLINTNQRLMRQFGTGLQIESELGRGTIVSFVVRN